MSIGTDAVAVGHALRDFLDSRRADERRVTRARYEALRQAFVAQYGASVWARVYEWILLEWELEPDVGDRGLCGES